MKSLSSYADIIPILDAALANGAVFYLKDHGAAVHWRQRAYICRTLKRKLNAAQFASIPGHNPSSPWDELKIDISNNEVTIRKVEPVAKVFDLEGRPISFKPQRVAQGIDLDLEVVAKSFKERLTDD